MSAWTRLEVPQIVGGAALGALLAVTVVGTAIVTDRTDAGQLGGTESTTLTVREANRGDVDETIKRIEEDDPRWNCHTDGNRICGENIDGMALLSAYLRSSGTVLS
ncbi:membrane protein [Rhodococcus phage Reynauld]|uniref:Membrane protein n=1 Tax=Rhodococcus phage Reynauld TaxID=3062845 RepID=A0ACD4ULK7_9CAUD|nr:membrane protein [Rhodococcus phage Reynauld]